MKNETARARYGHWAAIIPPPTQEIETASVSLGEELETRSSDDADMC